MLVTVQFPMADLRPFLPGETHRLLFPDWELPREGVDYVRFFGPVLKQGQVVSEWPGEHIFCSAARAIRFQPAFSIGSAVGLTRRYCAFRRFFSDGKGVSRIEVGIGFRGSHHNWTQTEFLSLLHDTLSLPVTVGRGAEAVKTDLFKADKALARLVLRSTTTTKTDPAFKPEPWWIKPGEPTLVIEYDPERDSIVPPAEFKTITDSTLLNVELAYGRMSFSGRTAGVWLFGAKSTVDADYRRRLRIHLLRLHAQREVVKEVLRAIRTGSLEPERTAPTDSQEHPSNRLQSFLRDTIERMERKRFSGLPQSELLRAAEEIQDSVTAGEREVILKRIEPLRAVVSGAVKRFTEQKTVVEKTIVVNKGGTVQVVNNTVNIDGNVDGDVNINQVVAETIQNSFNRVENSNASAEMKKRLEELHELVKKLVPKLPPDDQEKAAKNLEALTKEATSKKPDPAWYEVSAKGLMEAATAVADMASPITTAVKAVLALLI